jgi:hypothetical protein
MAIRNKLLQDIVAAVGGTVSSPITRNSLLQDWLDAILSGESPFSPLDLFQSGEQGAWYDPSDLTTLFQDDAGTTPVVSDGDPVGLMQDKSGNGNDATQSVSASRPTYRTDGTLHWLEFDGVDDNMYSSTLSISHPLLVGTGFVALNSASGTYIFDSAQRNCLTFDIFGFPLNRLKILGGDSNGASESSDYTDTTAQAVVAALGPSSYIRRNGTETATGTATNVSSTDLRIGSRFSSTKPLNGKIYQLIITDTAEDASPLDEYVAEKSGVTL